VSTEGYLLETLNITEIMSHIPHRYPFLLVDRVLGWETGVRLTALKNVTVNEPFFQGHFPGRPVMPGVLILEALAQACGLLAFKSEGSPPPQNCMFYLAGIDNARFKRPVEPGDQVLLEVQFVKRKQNLWMFAGQAKVDGAVAAQADIMCALRELSV
jgi:3-hydroxyacyl-[acyl-carrier-protein] dehydratase